MGYRTFVSMNIAVIGSGEIAEKYAARFAVAGHEVFMAWKNGTNARINPALSSLEHINFCTIEEASDIADLVIIAASPRDVREVSYWLGDVRRKVIIDATSNVPAAADEHVKTVCAIKAITGSPHIVKVFHTDGYERMLKPLFGGAKIGMLLAGESKKAKEITKILALELGIRNCHDFGGGESMPLFDEMTRCWRNLCFPDQKVPGFSIVSKN